jgi:choloylglycine hydrolase
MKAPIISPLFSALLGLIISAVATTAWSCTGLQLKAADGTFINGRTVEFGMAIDMSDMFIPRNFEFKATLPDGSTGLVYRSKYAVIGAITFGAPAIVDGINEKGLSIGMFYFPGYAGYTAVTPQNKKMALSPIEFPNWILTQFATIDEVKKNLATIVIVPTTPKGWPTLPPFHYVVYDKSGNSIAIEPIKGKLVVYDNPLGIFTNSPTFDWHMTNLSNYLNLTTVNTPPVSVDGLQLKSFGEGSGLHGLPGDFTPPSRFVRAAVFSSSAIPSPTSTEAVIQMFHILNQFDIPVGSVRSMDGTTIIPEYTLATAVKDPNTLKYYIRTFQDQEIRVMDMNAFNLNGKELLYIDLGGSTPITDISKTAKNTYSKNP